jgi:uncharacterized membrane protein YdjX (TVP38/TMEM64 family)
MTDPVNNPETGFQIRRWLPLAVILCLMALAYATGLHHQFTFRNIADHREALRAFINLHWVWAVLIYGGIYATAVALSFPAAGFLTVIGGLLLGWEVGAATTIISATLGATIIFLAAKTPLEGILTRNAGPLLTKVMNGFAENAFNYLLFLRLTPLFPFWVVNLASALARIPLKTFVAATFIGIIPITLVFSFVGSSLDSIIDAQKAAYEACMAQVPAVPCKFDLSLHRLITHKIIIAIGSLGLIALIPVIVKKFWGKQP